MSIAEGDIQSMITFGGYDLDRFAAGPLEWHDIDEESDHSHWQLTLKEM